MLNKLQAQVRIESIEEGIKASAGLFATALSTPGDILPRIRLVSDIPVALMEWRDSQGRWNTLNAIELIGVDMLSTIAEHQELTKRPDGSQWKTLNVIFFSRAFESFEQTALELKY